MLQLPGLSNLDLICLVKDLKKIKILYEIFNKTGPSTVYIYQMICILSKKIHNNSPKVVLIWYSND